MKSISKKAMTFLLLIPLLSLPLFARSPTWLKDSVNEIDKVGMNPTEEQMSKLGVLTAMGSRLGSLDAEQIEVQKRAQAKLLAISGSSEYFGNMIRTITDAEIAGTSKYHSSERWWQYETLQQLPSPETVKVLGELLFDEKGQKFTDDPVRDSGVAQANCRYAAKSMAVLIDKPPYDSKLYPSSDSALDSWRLWYQQVKAGTRTFCFKGSTVAYTLSGPATDKPEASHPNATSQPGTNSRATGSANSDVTEAVQEKSLWPKIAAGIAAVLALLGGWLAFRKRTTPA